MLIEKIEECLIKLNIEKEQKIAVAVSGGSDSLALILALKQCRQNIFGLIVDHKLRENSSNHALQTQDILYKNGIESDILIWEHDEILANIEGLARQNRYDLLLEKCNQMNIKYLFLGHHADDQIETFLLNLSRGSGIDGLCSMPFCREQNNITIVRPCLNLHKKTLQDFLINNKVEWLEDETNQDLSIKRNKLRDVLQELCPDLYEQRILLAIDHLQQAKEILDKHYNKIYNDLYQNNKIDYLKYINLLPAERTWLLNKILSKNNKLRLLEIKNLDKNILNNIKKSTLANYFIEIKNDSNATLAIIFRPK